VSAAAPHALLVALGVLGYYAVVVGSVGEWFARAAVAGPAARLAVARRWDLDELDSVVRLAIAGGMQLLFCFALIAATSLDPAALVPDHFQPLLVLCGVPLGIAEAALASFVGNVAMRTAIAAAPERVPRETREWLTIARGGWMRLYVKTAAIAPLPLVLVLALLYVTVEEVVFRGVLITALGGLGAPLALAVATGLFIAVQRFHMPSWQAALFPMAGALVVGVVHGLLFLAVPDLTPLIVAHFVLFLSAIV
jgi:hypothetical protein